MAGGSAIRGSRVGAGPMGENERGESAPRQRVSFFCANGHEVRPAFAIDAAVPDTWDCPRCGFPAGRESDDAAERAAQRAVQDAPGLREGAPLATPTAPRSSKRRWPGSRPAAARAEPRRRANAEPCRRRLHARRVTGREPVRGRLDVGVGRW